MGQSKISSCCICDWCKSRAIGGRGSPRIETPMLESFSADLPSSSCEKLLDGVTVGIVHIAW